MQLTHGSLFSGIGGFDLGFERAGIKTVWQVEIDPFCRKVLAKHFPEAERFEDVREVGPNLRWVDVISGGFPCQDISNAGKRVGIDGERSGLWSDMWRVIRLVRPRFVVVENVAALLQRGIERVLGDLAAGGFDAEWDCLPAIAFGAPHRRDRIFLVAYPSERGQPVCGSASGSTGHPSFSRKGLADSDGNGRNGRPAAGGREARIVAQRGRENGQPKMADASSQGLPQSEQQTIFGTRRRQEGRAITQCDWWATEPDVGRVAHGIPARVDRLKGLGNAVVPQIAEWIGRRILEANEVTP